MRQLQDSFRVGEGIFCKVLGASYACYFAGWIYHGPGLVGPKGLLPADQWLAVESQLAAPTVFRFGAGDECLTAAATLGFVFALHTCCKGAHVATLLAQWVLVVSFNTVGRDFYAFQWDALLAEMGFLAILLQG